MIEPARGNECNNLYRTCSYSVTTHVARRRALGWGAAVSATLACAAPLVAQDADVFEHFRTHCLTPMIEDLETNTEGLNRVGGVEDRQVWQPEVGDWSLVTSTDEAEFQFCVIIGALGAETEAWVETARASEDWAPIETDTAVWGSHAEVLQTVVLRNPTYQVVIDRDPTSPSLSILETDLVE